MFDVIHERYKRRRRRLARAASLLSTAALPPTDAFQFAPLQHVHFQRVQRTCSQQVVAQRFLQ